MVRVGQGFLSLLVTVLTGMLATSLVLNIYLAFFRSPGQSGIEAPLEFNFTWSLDSQKIVNGTFFLSVKMWISGENVTLVATANDDDYNESDYLGLVFDTNQNGYIDHYDQSYGLFADNRTVESDLWEHGFLGFVERSPIQGPQNVTFDSASGYTFRVQFPYYYQNTLWNPAQAIRNATNQIHICFWDYALFGWSSPPGVFTRFTFNV